MALKLGRTLAELSHSLSIRELMLWRDFFLQEPNDNTKLRYQIASHSSLYANFNSSKGEYTPADFFLDFEKREEPNEESSEDDFREKNKKVKADLLAQVKGMM